MSGQDALPEQRTLLTYCLGYGYCTGFQMQDDIIAQANFLAGGCTVTYSDGYWVEGAEAEAGPYHTKAKSELCMKIEIIVPDDRVPFVLKHMRRSIISAVKHDNETVRTKQAMADVGWVQVTAQPLNAHYFSAAEDL